MPPSSKTQRTLSRDPLPVGAVEGQSHCLVGTARSQREGEAETAGAGVACSDDSHSSQGAGECTQSIATVLQNGTRAASNSCSKAAVCNVGCRTF